MLTEDEARALTAEILKLARADETQISVSASRTTNLPQQRYLHARAARLAGDP